MNREQAQQLVGKRVSAWTAANGIYTGELVQVISRRGKPWRGRVRIDGVLEPACVFERGRAGRRGFRPGAEIEVGGSSIQPHDAAGGSYLEALQRAERKTREMIEKRLDDRNLWALEGTLAGLQEAIEEEQ